MDTYGKGGQERRHFKRAPASFPLLYRVKVPFEVRVQLGQSEIHAIAQDVGEGGLALLTDYEIPYESLIGLRFTIFNDASRTIGERSRYFELDAEVRYCALLKKRAYRLGVRFVSVSVAERTFIFHYVRLNLLKPSSFI